jgi:hypothetical protein
MKICIFEILDKAEPNTENVWLELGGGQTHNHPSDRTAVVTGATFVRP